MVRTQQKSKLYYLCLGEQGRDKNNLVSITTSLIKLREAVESLIHFGDITYAVNGVNGTAPRPEQIREIRRDWKTLSRTELNDKINGAFLGVTENGALI